MYENKNLRRLAFLEKKIKQCKKDLCEMESLSLQMQQTYCDNLDAIEKCEKEINILKSTPFVGSAVKVAGEGDVLQLPGILKQHDIHVISKGYADGLQFEKAHNSFSIIPPCIEDEDFGNALKDFMIQIRVATIKKLTHQNEKLIASLESLTEDFKE